MDSPLRNERSILRRYSYSFAVWNATFFAAVNLTLAIRNLQIGAPLAAVVSGLASVASAIAAWSVVWLEAKVRLTLREMEATMRGAMIDTEMKALFVESLRKGDIDTIESILSAKKGQAPTH